MSDRTLLDAIEALTHKKRSFDVLRLLIEDGDHATALVVAAKLRSDLDIVLNELSRLSGQPIPVDAPPSAPQAPAVVPGPSRGYLGEEEGPGKFERWVEALVRRGWNLVSNPGSLAKSLKAYRGRLALFVGIALLWFTASRAYDTLFLNGMGLMGEYYLDTELKTLFTRRLDRTVDFRWLRRPPLPNYRAEQFSIRWTGYVMIDEPGTYEFFTISDDGVRLWIDDQQLIDNWTIHGGSLDKGDIVLTPGYHKVRLEYYQNAGDMVIKLHWKRPTDKIKKVIAARYLRPEIPND